MASRRQRALLNPGTPAPDFRLVRVEGGETGLGELTARGRVLLVFFKVTCPTCQFTMPFLERIHRAGTLAVCGISQDDAEDTRDFERYFGASFPTLMDDEAAGFPSSNAYGVASVPSMFLVEPDGKISRVTEGWNKMEMEELAAIAGMTLFRPDDNVPAWRAG
jgi:peroxiredoxin